MRNSGHRIVLLSCYELGHQPLGLATPLAFLSRAGFPARAIDLAVEPLDETAVAEADFVFVSTPMHTALRLGLELLPRLRRLASRAHVGFFGLYATLNADVLLRAGADSALGGECEEAMVALVRERAGAGHRSSRIVLEKLSFPLPNRSELPELDRYARLELPSGEQKTVGAVDTTRGCLHSCRHCPIPPVYQGRFFVIPRETVLRDVGQLVEAGARHVDFVDPDFLNGPRHALEVARAVKARHPELTFNFTAKIEHLVRYRKHLRELADLGGVFVISAVESLSDRVLTELEKGHGRRDVSEALEAVRESGMAFRPTFVPFTPWTTRSDYVELFQWIAREGLVSSVDPVQLSLRLLIPPGSLLLTNASLRPHLLDLDPESLTYRWEHPDSEMDALQEGALRIVEEGLRDERSGHAVFHRLAELALGSSERLPGPFPTATPPRLTEAWFC